MKIDELVPAEYATPGEGLNGELVEDDAGSLARNEKGEPTATVEATDEDTYQDLCQALWYLESCVRMLGFFSDQALAPKLMKVDRERMAKLAKDIQEFVFQWDS